MTKILLVEDDKSLREIYGVRLLAEGYDIVSAGDGEEALAMAIKERPQLIVSDVMMPKISGFDMLDILRSTTETKDIKVIMMTALSSEDQRARGEALGADRYLVKSQVGIEDVVRTVHEVLGDAPSARATPAQMFNTPATTPASQPSRPASPSIPSRPAASPLQSAPAAPSQQPTPVAAPQTQPPRPVAPYSTQPASTPKPSTLPQPTAPFSTARPANLGERVIHPISQSDGPRDIGSLMEQELNQAAPQPSSATPPTPASQPTPAPVAQNTPQQSQPPTTPEPQTAPQSASVQQQPSQPAEPPSGFSFEETPRQSGPIPNPFTHQGPQPPAR